MRCFCLVICLCATACGEKSEETGAAADTSVEVVEEEAAEEEPAE